jgi:hypothetical protein
VGRLYADLLNRPTAPPAGAVAAWAGSTLDLLGLEVAFAASDEFQANG